MTRQEQYKQACEALQPEVTAEDIYQRAEREETGRHRRRAYLPALVAAVLVLLIGSVAAAGIAGGWLTPLVQNAEDYPGFEDTVEFYDSTVEFNGIQYTLDKVLAENNSVFFQVTAKAEPDKLAKMMPFSYFAFEGNWLPGYEQFGFNGTSRRLDDGSDPSVQVILYYADLDVPKSDSAGRQLRLMLRDPETGECAPWAEFTTNDGAVREVTLIDGSIAELGSFSLQIRGNAFFRIWEEYPRADDDLGGVILKDGTVVHFIAGGGTGTDAINGIAVEEDGLENDLYECAVDPYDIVQIYYGDLHYKILP